MADEWEPLPQRKRSRRALGAATGAEAAASLPTTATPAAEGTAAAATATTDPADTPSSSAPAPSRHAAPDAANLEKVDSAVLARAASRRAAREGGERGMGNDGVAGEFYEYLDHTADVQFHVWGKDLAAALEHLVPCMSNYMTDLSTVEIDPSRTQELEVEGHDLPSLLFAYLDEFLFRFSTEAFVAKRATLLEFTRPPAAQQKEGEGDAAKPPPEGAAAGQGGGSGGAYRVRVRAEGEGFDLAKHPQGTEIKAITYSNMQIHEKEGRADIYVIVDI